QNQSNNAITLPTEIQIPKPKIDSISCKIEFSESKNIDGLNMIVGSYSEPDYDLFCNNDIVENLNSKKSSLNDIPHEKFTAARSKANPYEKIENYIFINRSAIKLACLDALFSFTRTKRYDPVKDL
ncbi:24296_t:CDS:2, partial [Entrophospora sp. SA101]